MMKFFKRIIALLTATVLIFLALTFGVRKVREILYPLKYNELIVEASNEYNIDPSLLFAVVRTESSFKPDAVSIANARGLTQITEDTFNWLLSKTGEEYSFDDLFTPEVSIKYGAYFLGILMSEYGKTQTAVAAYHAGMGNVSSWLDQKEYSSDGKTLDSIPIDDTAYYVTKVMKAKIQYEKLYEY